MRGTEFGFSQVKRLVQGFFEILILEGLMINLDGICSSKCIVWGWCHIMSPVGVSTNPTKITSNTNNEIYFGLE